jgi:hypothetical protein
MTNMHHIDPDIAGPPLFESFNSYSLKREAVNIGNPALIWHRAYWRPKQTTESTWHGLLNRYISESASNLEEFCDKNGGKYEQQGAINEFGEESIAHYSAADPYSDLSSSWLFARFTGLRVTIAFEKFDEFWSIKLIVDYSRYADDDILPDGFYNTAKLLISAEQLILDGLSEKEDQKNNDELRLAKRLNVDKVSVGISNEIVDITEKVFPRLTKNDNRRSIISTNDLFANFVGFSFGYAQSTPPMRLPHKKVSSVSENLRPTGVLSDENHLIDLIDAIWPLTKRLNPLFQYKLSGSMEKITLEEIVGYESRREFTMSTIDEGRAIYVTSLGGNRSPNSNVFYPLSYLIICPHKATWQIGRFVDRIHTLGMFRLAALKEYQKIEDSSIQIRSMLNRLYLRDDTGKISREFDILCSSIDGGLHERVERSRYYIDLFREGLTTIEFGKISGYQRYPEFISRKFSGRFQTINNVSRSIDFLSRELSLHINRETNSSIKELLEFADLVSIVPIAYYSYHVFENLNDLMLDYIGTLIRVPWTIFWAGSALFYAVYILILKRILSRRRFKNEDLTVLNVTPPNETDGGRYSRVDSR